MMRSVQRLSGPFLFLMLVGCGGSNDPRVSGMVILDNQPLNNAVVTFIPQGETPGLGGSGKTGADGKYTIVPGRGGSGLPVGEYKVTISCFLRPDGSIPDPKTPPIESDARETLPESYHNRDSTILKATVGKEGKTYDFTLQGTKGP